MREASLRVTQRGSSMVPYVHAERVRESLERCLEHVGPWSVVVFRCAGVKYASRSDLLSGAGARRYGGRWNPPGLFNCVYGSLDASVAQREALSSYAKYGIPWAECARWCSLPYRLDSRRCSTWNPFSRTREFRVRRW